MGGGGGLLSDALARPGTRLVTVEPDPLLVGHLATKGSSRLLARGRAESLPFADHSFDVVLSTWILSYTSDPWASVREMARVCSRRATSRVALIQAAPDNDLVELYNVCARSLGEPLAHHGFLIAGAAEILAARGFVEISLQRCPVSMDFSDLPVEKRCQAIASLVRRMHHEHVEPEAVEGPLEAAIMALPGAEAGLLRDDGVLLVARREG